MSQPFKVRITGPKGEIVFEASAPVSEQRQATYGGFDIVHLPTNIHSYKNTSSRKWTITGTLVSRTVREANANSRNLDLARSWILPEFGSTGAPPPILKLYAYKNKNINGRNVVLVSYDWSFPNEVYYIYEAKQPMPIIGQLTLNVEEVYSAEEITAGAWKMDDREIEDALPSGSREAGKLFNITTPGRLMQQLGSAVTSIGGGSIQTVANALEGSIKPTLAGVIAGKLTRSLGAKILNSPQIAAIASKLPTFARNIFVSGTNAVVGDLGRIASNRVSQATAPAAPGDPFGKSALNAPRIIGGEGE